MDTTEGREWQLWREQDGIISSPGWPGCRSSCASETQGTLTDRGVSQWAQTPKRTQHIEQHKPLKFQMGKAVAIPRCKDRWARSIFNNTRTSLCVYHWRDAEWAQLGSLSTADGEAKIPMFWCFGISDLPGANLPSDQATDPSALHPTPQGKRNTPWWLTSKPWNNTHCTFPSTQGETGRMLKWFWSHTF